MLRRALAVILIGAVTALAEDVAVQLADVATRQAPELKTTNHGPIAQNVRIPWYVTVPDVVYGTCGVVRDAGDGQPQNTPFIFRLDLKTGKLTEHYRKGEMLPPTDDDGGEPLTTGWLWETPTCVSLSADGRVWIGSSAGWVVQYFPEKGAFRTVFRLNGEVPAGIAATKDGMVVLTESRALYLRDITGMEKLGKVELPAGMIGGLNDELTTQVGGKFFNIRLENRRPEAVPVAEAKGAFKVEGGIEPVVAGRSLVFKKAAWDHVKALTVGPDGRHIYGAGWPMAWIWEFDPDTNKIHVRGHDYEWYEMIPFGKELFVIGYYGIKLVRWDPSRPWTFDQEKHYQPTQTWGAKESNPRLVAMFRYFNALNIRRPSGFALGGDGRFYAGGKNAAHMFYLNRPPWQMEGTRYCGALCWYDPQTETIGIERDPFLHHEVTDICAVGDEYIAAVGKTAANPFDPRPDNTSGKFALFDVRNHRFVHDEDLTGRKLLYVTAGKPGHVVIAGPPSKYAGPGVQSLLVVFDVKTMKTVRVVQLPVEIRWNQYDSAQKFETGPDGCVYFYGADKDGTALFRFHSDTGAVEPVFREKGVSDFAVYMTPGPAFCFAKDRVYFGTTELRSLPVDKVLASPVMPTVRQLTPGTDHAPVASGGVWKWPHEIVWQSADGPAWFSVGRTATILTIEPSGKELKLSAYATNALDKPLASLTIPADDPHAAEPKTGLHRKSAGNWDFGFGALPKAPFTFLGSMFFQRSETFRYCLTVHAQGESFEKLSLFVLVAELHQDPAVVDRSSWPEGAPMPAAQHPTPVKTEWPRPVRGRLELNPLRLGPAAPSVSPTAPGPGPSIDKSMEEQLQSKPEVDEPL